MKILKNKHSEEQKRRRNSIKDFKKANNLLKENIDISEQIYNKMEVYDKLERGEYLHQYDNSIKLVKPKKIVRLFGIGSGNDESHISLNFNSDEEKASLSASDISDPYLDFDVCKADYEN